MHQRPARPPSRGPPPGASRGGHSLGSHHSRSRLPPEVKVPVMTDPPTLPPEAFG